MASGLRGLLAQVALGYRQGCHWLFTQASGVEDEGSPAGRGPTASRPPSESGRPRSP
jgi:hypothetical protein